MQMLTTTVAKYLFAIPFAVFGIFHFVNANAMATMVPSFIPGGALWVYVTGAALLAASASLISGIQTKNAMVGLGAMLGIFVLTIHLPGLMSVEASEAAKMASTSQFLKDTALAGAAFTMANVYSDEKVSEKVSA